jgi:hypothetical protein
MNRFLHWLSRNRRFLDIETFDHIELQTWIPLWAALLAGGALVFAAFYLYRRVARDVTPRQRAVLTVLRAGAYAALLFVAVAPQLGVDGQGKPEGPLPVVIDRTESMTIRDVGETTRLQAADRLDRALEKRAGDGQGLVQHSYLFGEDVLSWNRAVDPLALLEGADEPSTTTTATATAEDASEVVVATRPLARGNRTSLTRLMEGALRPHRGAYVPALLVIGDGAHNAADSPAFAAEKLRQEGVPVYFLPVGRERPRDIALDHIVGEDIVFVEEAFKFHAALRQWGFTGRDFPVKCMFGDTPVTLPDFSPEREGELTLPIEHTPAEPGLFDLTLEIPADPAEMTDRNNRVSRRVRVIKDRIRVLLVFSQPSWEYRFLVSAFEKDRRVEPKIYLHSVDQRFFRHDQERFLKELPEKKEDLFKDYDMVVLGDIDAHALLSKDFRSALVQFVSEEGGGLVIASDDRNTPFSFKNTELEDLLPIVIESLEPVGPGSFRQEMAKSFQAAYRLRIAPDGEGSRFVTFDPDPQKNADIWANFPDMYEVCPEGPLKPGAVLLVEAVSERNPQDKRTAIAYQNYGRGIVLYMGFNSTWRWRKEHGDRYFRDYWGKMVQFLGLPHMLGGQAQSRIYLDRLECGVGQRVTLSVQARNPDYTPYEGQTISITMTPPDGAAVALELPRFEARDGIFRTVVYPDRPGPYRFALDRRFMAEEQELNAVVVNREFLDPGVNLDLIHSIARETGGGVFDFTAALGTNRPSFTDDPEIGARHDALLALAESLRAEGAEPLARAEFADPLAEHILKTISARRMSARIRESASLWDTPAMLLLVMLLLCLEYFLRKRWYLD